MRRLLFCASGFALLALITTPMQSSNAPPGQQDTALVKVKMDAQQADMQQAVQKLAALQNQQEMNLNPIAKHAYAAAKEPQATTPRRSALAATIVQRDAVVIGNLKASAKAPAWHPMLS